ncbi:XAC2610-related protein [Pseudomonas sp. NY15181]|uniref:XAC2610-related protein n=1 Tax=Pseudomonas sp. NY15181 TaxID=3400349 RepID=UPI003A871485
MRTKTTNYRLLACLLPLLAIGSPVFANDVPNLPAESFEFPGWSRKWVGTVGDKQVEASLNRVGNSLSGAYCYQPCSIRTRNQLALTGQMSGEMAELTERDSSNGNVPTGLWRIESMRDRVIGQWTSSTGERKLALELRPDMTGFAESFPYEIRLLANRLPDEGDDSCLDPPIVSAIRLYRGGELFQSLPTESQGTCGVFTPRLIDANFDGWPDVTIALSLPAGPDIPYQTWLYDPESRRFVDAPIKLQDITSPEFDPVHRVVYSYWRASCCEHGVTTYRWQDGDVEEIDSQSSYVLPVLDKGQRRGCYIMPSYENGFIEYASRVEQSANGRLKLHGVDPKTCDLDEGSLLERTYIDIWQPSLDGQQPIRLRSEKVAWKLTETSAGQRFCPEVPFFDKDRVRRVVLRDNLDLCSESSPQ